MAKPIQDKYVAKLWLNEAISRSRRAKQGPTLAQGIFIEKMIKEKFRVELWHIEYIGKAWSTKPSWAPSIFKRILKEHK